MPEDFEQEQFTEKKLERALWFVTHKLLLRKIGFGLLIFFDVVTIGYGLYGYLDYYLISWNKDLAIRRNMPKLLYSPQMIVFLAPKPLDVASVNVFSSGAARYDFLAKIQNENTDWYATFTYQFNSGTDLTPESTGFILPGEEKYIGQFGQSTKGASQSAELKINNINWKRFDKHVIADYPLWNKNRLNFITSNITQTGNLKIDSIIGRTSFDIENRTAFGYWRTGLLVLLLRGASPAAANYFSLDNFDSGQTRHVDINWFEQLPASTSVEIHPEVNIFDPQVYMPPRSEK